MARAQLLGDLEERAAERRQRRSAAAGFPSAGGAARRPDPRAMRSIRLAVIGAGRLGHACQSGRPQGPARRIDCAPFGEGLAALARGFGGCLARHRRRRDVRIWPHGPRERQWRHRPRARQCDLGIGRRGQWRPGLTATGRGSRRRSSTKGGTSPSPPISARRSPQSSNAICGLPIASSTWCSPARRRLTSNLT